MCNPFIEKKSHKAQMDQRKRSYRPEVTELIGALVNSATDFKSSSTLNGLDRNLSTPIASKRFVSMVWAKPVMNMIGN